MIIYRHRVKSDSQPGFFKKVEEGEGGGGGLHCVEAMRVLT